MAKPDTALRNEKGQRVCSDGCGAILHSRHPYIKGHNKTPGAPATATPKKRGRPATNGHAAPLSNGAQPPPAAVTNGNGNGRESAKIVGAVSEFAMDKIWVKLTPAEKFDLLFPQEPAHA
jgi:hypothetical protein